MKAFLVNVLLLPIVAPLVLLGLAGAVVVVFSQFLLSALDTLTRGAFR